MIDEPLQNREGRGPFDWRTALAFVWAFIFALLYARMVIVERVPQLASWLPR